MLFGQAHPDAIVEILIDDALAGEATADAEGFWTFDVLLDTPGEYLFSVRAIVNDTVIASGDEPALVIVPSPTPTKTPTPTNTSMPTATPTRTPIPTATWTPMAPVIDPQSAPTTDMDGHFTIAGQASPGDAVEILVDSAAVGLAIADDAGRWSHRLAIDAPGRHLIAVNAIIGELRRPGGSEPMVVMIAPTLTPTNTPTHTPTKRPTNTPVPPTSTPTNTPTLTITPLAGTVREFDGIPFIYVSAGEFEMGSETYSDEQPIHTVDLDSYWIMQTEVTNVQYTKCVAAEACREPSNDRWNDESYGDHPVTHVNWDDAVAYATWLSGETELTTRLPTEAEWEKAARGTDGRIYPWGDTEPDSSLANYGSNEGDTTSVGSYLDGASPYGALDMAGSVWEWTADWYDSDYYATSPNDNPQGPDSGDRRVVRGGSWSSFPNLVRAPYRFRSNPDYRYVYLGFRLASPHALAVRPARGGQN